MSDKLQKASSEVSHELSDFAKTIDDALAERYIERCWICGSREMNDTQAQEHGVCSGKCAEKHGVSKSERVDLLAVAKSLRKCTNPGHKEEGRTCASRAGIGFNPCHVDCRCCSGEKYMKVNLPPSAYDPKEWAATLIVACLKCCGAGSISIPGEPEDEMCPACDGSGEER